jgi:S1-C subfamily serine protease
MDRSSSSSKRKTQLSPSNRPAKQMRPESDSNTLPPSPILQHVNGLANANGDGSSSEHGVTSTSAAAAVVIDSDEIKPLSRAPTATAEAPEWQATIERVVKNVVAIHFCQTCSFDTDPALSSEATGFVVDAERGYILTNRHVVGAGPFWGHCIFDNHEEVSWRGIKTSALN